MLRRLLSRFMGGGGAAIPRGGRRAGVGGPAGGAGAAGGTGSTGARIGAAVERFLRRRR
ncbi:MAG TPA: hypothetical protein VG474_07165 [Solirubrobacteraceae bacterium]|nr:hypothetical protein [Solirubrobacteraceae bacterium]